MSLADPPRTLRASALEAVRLIARDLTDPAFRGGWSQETELARFAALASWAEVGRTIAPGEWSDDELLEFVERCLEKFDTCEQLLEV